MAKYEIKDVVCDYGLYEDGELKLILNSARNAHIIKRILEIDGSVPNVATAADVVEVVRCKDCIHKTLTQDGEYNPDDIVCGYFMTDGLQENDFCSYGERKAE